MRRVIVPLLAFTTVAGLHCLRLGYEVAPTGDAAFPGATGQDGGSRGGDGGGDEATPGEGGPWQPDAGHGDAYQPCDCVSDPSCDDPDCDPACPPGWYDCNHDPADGCESDRRTLTDCGLCGQPCELPQAIASCSTGACRVQSCEGLWLDCTASPGCETPSNTLENCGGCGTVCDVPNESESCSTGSCQPGDCEGLWLDCTAEPGCETPSNTDTHCGACDAPCVLPQADGSCASGSCEVVSCVGRWLDCTAEEGCETRSNTLSNCGECGRRCSYANAQVSCSTGTCTVTSCREGWEDCTGGPDCETDLTADATCGSCTNDCGAGGWCHDGACVNDRGMAVWARTGLATPRYSLWNGGSFASIAATANVGEWRIIAGAAARTRDEVIVVGVDEGESIGCQRWDGSTWTRASFSPMDDVSDSFYWGFDVAYEALSDHAVVVWNNGSGLSHRVWNGSTWLAESSLSTAAEPRQMQLAANPNSDELALVYNASGSDYARIWNGTSWGSATPLDSSAGDTDVHVAYEQQRGRAMVVYGKNGDPDGYYRLWNGSVWTGEAPVPALATETREVRWMTLAADPSSDRIALGVVTSGPGDSPSHIWLSVWTGSGWETPFPATNDQDTNPVYPNVAVAFEGLSGEALAVYPLNDWTSTVTAARWTASSGWSVAAVPDVTLGSDLRSMMLTADPASDRVMLMALREDRSLYYAFWDGSAWAGDDQLQSNTGEYKNQPFLFLWLRR